ncbi:MAG: DUF6364 family protein [Candidatus Saccharimonadales bacterium]
MRTTITINDKLYKAAKVRAAESGETLSSFVEEYLKNGLLEDLDDIETAKKRENEPLLSFDKLVNDLKAEGLL